MGWSFRRRGNYVFGLKWFGDVLMEVHALGPDAEKLAKYQAEWCDVDMRDA
jgi:hypothetical protein